MLLCCYDLYIEYSEKKSKKGIVDRYTPICPYTRARARKITACGMGGWRVMEVGCKAGCMNADMSLIPDGVAKGGMLSPKCATA